ncbi:hypothetical protein HDV62DRAFT_350364 [Trichoderma sp. SZMC 28011]
MESSKRDPELGEQGEQGGPSSRPNRHVGCFDWLSSRIKTWTKTDTATKDACDVAPRQTTRQMTGQIEDFPPGYPQFSALVASHNSFHICRRFSTLRTRLLLLKQDRLSILERQLEKIDRNEKAMLSLGSCRVDKNEDRRVVLTEIDDALADYDAFLERHQRALTLSTAPSRPVTHLCNWVESKGSIARAETAYLEHQEDIFSLAAPEDNIISWLETLAEYIAFYSDKWFAKAQNPQESDIYIFPPSLIQRAVRVFLVPLVTVLLLTPVIICNFIDGLTARLVIVVFATTGFIAALSCLIKIRAIDLIIAGATYTTVLVVFISGTGGANY